MKGIVFNMFNEMIEEKFGFEMWDQLLESTKPDSEGIYTSTETYPDGELMGYVGALSEVTSLPVADLVGVFGEHCMTQFATLYPNFFAAKNAKEMLQSVDGVIHVEVRKLHPGVGLPEFEYEDPGPDQLVMKYRSPRKLCSFAVGLINGTATHYGIVIENKHSLCMNQGADHCRFELAFKPANGSAS